MPPRFVVAYTTAGPGQAAIIKELLAAEGIPAVTSQEGAGAAYGLTVGPLGLVDILVPEQFAAQAEAVLDAMRRGDLADGDSTPAPEA